MKKQVVRAGTYFSVGILFIASLPVLLPLLFFLSIFGFAFVVPLGCALAAFLYLRKYVGMLFRKLPSTLGACLPWGRRRRPLPGPRPGPPLPIDACLRDQPAIETFESVDPEFDAVVISTAPREEEPGSFGGADAAEAVSSADVSADDGTGREGVDDEDFVQDRITVGEKDDETIADNGANREGADDDEIAEKGSRKEVITLGGKDDETITDNGTSREGGDDDEIAEKGSGKEGITVGEKDYETISDNGTNRDGTEDDEIAEKGSRKEGLTVGEKDDETISDNGTNRDGTHDDEIAEKDTRKEGSDGDVFTENRIRPAGADDDMSAGCRTRDRIDVPTFAENGTKREETSDDTSPENVSTAEGEADVSGDYGTKKEGIVGDTPDDDVNKSARIDDDKRLDDTRGPVPELDRSAKDGTGTEWKDSTSIEDGTRKEEAEHEIEYLNEEKMENTKPSAANNGESLESPEEFARTSGVEQIEERNEQDEVHAKSDGGAHPEVDDEEEGSEGVETPSEETKEEKREATIDEGIPGELGDDRHRKSVPSAIAGVTPGSFREASENESPTKPDGVRHLLPNQAHEDDIWICKECGWKYPNAKPSAKIRRNHKKNCMGSSARAPAPDGRIHKDVINPGHEDHSQLVNLDSGGTQISSAGSDEHDEQVGVANEFPAGTSESFRSASDELPQDIWSSFDSGESHYDNEQDQLAQLQQELQLSDDLDAVKGVVGDKHVSTGPLVTDIEELSEFLGIDLPARSADLPEIEWAKLAIEVMKVVVGLE